MRLLVNHGNNDKIKNSNQCDRQKMLIPGEKLKMKRLTLKTLFQTV